MQLHLHNAMRSVFFTVAALSCALAQLCEAEEHWEIEPYRIQAVLAIDAPGDLNQLLAAELPAYLEERASATAAALWQLRIEIASGSIRHQLLRGVDSLKATDLSEAAPKEDKRILLSVEATPWDYRLAAREFDRRLQRWGDTLHTTIRQRDAIPEQLFTLLRQSVSPLAHVRPDEQNDQKIIMEMRGAALPRRSPDFDLAEPGDLFVPVLRRTNREGKLTPNGVQSIPWTYIEVVRDDQQPADSMSIVGKVQSGSRRTLSVRKRARVELIAIGIRANPGETTVRLRSRIDRDKPLIGYDVFAKDADEEQPRLVGLSDVAGEVRVPSGKSTVQMLFVKSRGELLARVPIVPGVDDVVTLPLPDNDLRLQAEARLAALREDLVDLVARRNIFMARIRQEIENKDYKRAGELLESLDELPGRTQFAQTLDRESRAHQTKDPQIQKRIDQLFTATQTALGQYLDPRPIAELHEELRKAKSEGS